MKMEKKIVPGKGTRGYIDRIKKLALLVSGGTFLLAAALFVTGLLLFESKFNVLSIFAALIIIPFAGGVTRFVLFARYKSVSEADEAKVFEAAPAGSSLISDAVMTSEQRAMGFAFIVVTDHEVVALAAKNEKFPKIKLYEYLKDLVKRKGFSHKVEVEDDMDAFLKVLGRLPAGTAKAEGEEDPQSEVIDMLHIYMA